MSLSFIFLVIIVLFSALLLVRNVSGLKFCVICVSFSLTWLLLLALYILGEFEDILILGLLMGQSILGIYYLFEGYAKKGNKDLLIFRLPFLLTLLLVFYLVLNPIKEVLDVLLVLAALWGILGLIYLFQQDSKLQFLAKKITECCKDW